MTTRLGGVSQLVVRELPSSMPNVDRNRRRFASACGAGAPGFVPRGGDLLVLAARAPGVAGTITTALGPHVVLTLDAARPHVVVDVGVRRPLTPATVAELEVVFGRPAWSPSTTPVSRHGRFDALVRLALLRWACRFWPVPSPLALWRLERLALCLAVATPATRAQAAADRRALADAVARTPDADPSLKAIAAGDLDAVEVDRTVDALRRGLAATPPVRRPGPGTDGERFPVEWDLVPRLVVDPCEGALILAPGRRRVSVAACPAGRPAQLFVRVAVGDASEPVPLHLERGAYVADLPAPVPPGAVLELTAWPRRGPRSPEERRRARCRRAAFRALAAERRAVALDAVDRPEPTSEAWSVAAVHWREVASAAGDRRGAREADRRAQAAETRGERPPAADARGHRCDEQDHPAFLAELATDPSSFDDAFGGGDQQPLV